MLLVVGAQMLDRGQQASLTGVDVLVAALDQSVGEGQQRVPGEEREGDRGALDRADAEEHVLGDGELLGTAVVAEPQRRRVSRVGKRDLVARPGR